MLWVGALQIMLDKGKELDWFHSPQIVALAVVAVVGFAFFLIWELTDEHPVVDLRLFKRRNFWTGTLTMSVGYGLFFGNVVLLPLWLQQYMGYTATDAGMVMAPVGLLAIMLLADRRQARCSKVDPRRYATFAFLVFALVLWMRSRLQHAGRLRDHHDPDHHPGRGDGLLLHPAGDDHAVGPRRRTASPAASGLSQLRAHHRRRDRHLDRDDAVGEPRGAAPRAAGRVGQQRQRRRDRRMNRLGRRRPHAEQALAQINRMVDQQAFMLAANDVFSALGRAVPDA